MKSYQISFILLIGIFVTYSSAFFRQITPISIKEEGQKSFLEMVRTHGYPVLSKFIETDDGYILNIFRIPGKKGESVSEALYKVADKEPVLMVHGILSTSENFILNGPEISPAYQLADTDRYDIWFVNVRGNSYSKLHTFYDSSSSLDFWQFSFEEFGDFDIPNTVDYILKATKKSQLSIIAFSQGTTSTFHSLATKKDFYQDKVKVFLALAPVITVNYSEESFMRTLSDMEYLGALLNRYGYLEAFPTESSTENQFQMLGQLCEFIPEICTATIDVFANTRSELINEERISVYTSQFVDSSSLKNLLHMSQIMKAQKFQHYDYGYEENFQRYGTYDPPEIDISAIDVPIGMFVGKYDTLATLGDNEENKSKIKNLIHYQEYELDHLSFILAKDMSYFKDVIANLDNYNGFGNSTTTL